MTHRPLVVVLLLALAACRSVPRRPLGPDGASLRREVRVAVDGPYGADRGPVLVLREYPDRVAGAVTLRAAAVVLPEGVDAAPRVAFDRAQRERYGCGPVVRGIDWDGCAVTFRTPVDWAAVLARFDALAPEGPPPAAPPAATAAYDSASGRLTLRGCFDGVVLTLVVRRAGGVERRRYAECGGAAESVDGRYAAALRVLLGSVLAAADRQAN